jgi:light-regulated signal transduction histidine kinase (bacteriophytochrome)
VAAVVGTRSVYRPARQLSAAAALLAEGDLSARAAVASRTDEFGALGRDFNAMADSIEFQVAELEKARKKLDAFNAELEERVRRRTAELEASNDELAAFSYSVSHDLRSPLRAIDGFSRALVEDYADVLGDQGRDDLRRVRQAANRMGELIDSLLRLSRLSRQQMRLEKVDLSAIAREVADSLRQEEPDRDVVFQIEAGVTGLADASLVRIVLDNLLGNAWKFTGKRQLAHIEVGSRKVDGETVYYVRDDGAGFDMAYVDKLFGAFQRIHGQAEFPGIGIGLATTARIIRRHGGRVWAEGEPEKGATFFFTLS